MKEEVEAVTLDELANKYIEARALRSLSHLRIFALVDDDEAIVVLRIRKVGAVVATLLAVAAVAWRVVMSG